MKKMRNEVIIAAVFICFVQLISCNIMSRNYGKHFTECIKRIVVKNRKTPIDLIGKQVEFYCKSIEQFRTSHERDFPGKRLTPQESDWAYGLLEKGEKIRVKRQAAGHGAHRRQEYRTLSDRQRSKYHAAIQGLKSRIIGNSTQYDILARVHTGITQITAHGGCNFLGWHRVYLNMYESALQLVDPSVTLPYWDSTCDNYMPKDDQENSIIWADDFLGTPHGTVTTGFAANWTSDRFGPLTRNVGRAQGAALMSDEEIQGVINKTRMHEICGDNSQIDFDLEFIHGPPHIFVDGQMGNIESAAYEPVFYMHHAFIDLIWELFREHSLKNGVDVENDYPAEGFGDLFHHGDRAMGLGNRTIKDGLLNREIKGKYFYAPRPTCTLTGRRCPGKYLKCVSIDGKPKCISKTIKEVEEERLRPTTPPPTLPPLECPKPNYPHDPQKEQRSVQNTFCANGKSDTNEWVYLPVQILTARAPDYGGYNSYNVKNGHTDRSSDLYNPNSYSQLKTYLRPGRPKTFNKCHTENGTAGQIFIQSDGLNYEGSYKDFAIVDNRLAISVSITYVAIKDPEKTSVASPDQQYRYSDVLLSAYDSCGRLCRPNCLVPNKTPPTYRPCTGALRITPEALQGNFYGKDYGGASENIWDFRRERSCPQYKTDQIFVSFYCDYSNRWPWILSDTPVDNQASAFTNQPAPVVPAKPTLKECPKPLPWDNFGNCLVESTDCEASCTSTQIYKCIGTCDEYYWCAKGREGVTMCKYGQRFDYVDGKPQCVPATAASCPGSYDRRKRYLARLALTRGRNRAGRGRAGRRRWK